LTIALVELIRTAWISDDAAITLRCVLNFINGFGATFNIDERVQTYTHPLWFLLISAASPLTRNIFASTFVLSIGMSLAVLWVLITRVASSFWAGVLAASVLIFSKAYVDFSTSGLENPLSHLLILLAVVLGVKASERPGFAAATGFFFTCSLLYLTRPDLLVVILPASLLVMVRHRHTPGELIKAVSIGALPAIAWTLLSLYYYGFPFPNTAYAKLGTGIPLGERVIQGGRYLLDSLNRDRLTLPFVLAATIIGLRSSLVDKTFAVGGILYLAYVVSIGGDFMTGRFLTPPLLVATAVMARAVISRQQLQMIAIGVGLLAVTGLNATLLSGSGYENTTIDEATGIADERGYYFHRYGLVMAPHNTFAQPHWEIGERSVSVLCANLGFTGLEKGPGAHLIDDCALADPLLARLPAERTRKWRIGHFQRQLPTDYQESIEQHANLLADSGTRTYYESIRTITRGKLNSLDRLREVVRMNLGQVQKPDWDMYHHTKVPRSSKPSVD
jgi:arabinofuranosyltransferase